MRGGEGAGLGLVAGSFDLVERFALFRREPQCFGELPRARRDALLGRWQALLGGEAALERRLALEGLDRAAAARALGPITLADDYPRPPWLDIIGDVLDAMREGTGEPTLAELAELEAEGDDSEPLPFAHYYRPWVRVGLARLERQVGERWLRLAARPRRQLARALARELARAGTQTLLGELDAKRAASNTPRAEGAPPTVIYDGLVAELHGARAAALLAGYPCLARLWATRLDLWVASSAELLARVDADRAQLEATFGARGELSALDLSLSDPHDGGRQVAALRFADGQAVIYKPKDLTTERAFFALVAWLEARDAPLPALRALRVLERDGYGYVERVAPAPCPDEAALAQFERRSGALLALVHVLQGVDYHHENLIAAADQPLLVDHETLLAPALPDAGDEASADDHAAIRLARSVLRTGLLPQPSREPGGFVGDHSGLGAREAAGARTAYRFEGAPNSDEMRIVPTERIVSQASQPRLRDGGARASTREAAAQRRARVLEGFRCTYDALAAHADTLAREDGGPLAALRSAWTRVVLRPTTTYDTLLRHSRRPTLLRDAVVRGLSFDRLAPAALEDGAPPWALPVLRAEHRALWRGDVPRFLARADGTGLFARDAVGAEQHAPLEIAGDVLPMAPWQALHRGLRALGPDDLHLQSALIETSLHAASAARQRLHGAPAETGVAESASPAKLAADGGGGATRDSRPAAEPRTLALAIADRLLCDAVDVSGARQHVGVDLDPSSGLPTVGLLGPTLYSGR
ncbi:MAG: type 2 lantipeptide synthetase LanM, partial [Myxococcales bacterium]|nr:type 2 lantipeptide synthetase LanM [Myxococcales bacterium]